MSAITSSVLQRGKPRFTMTGQSLPTSLHETGEGVSNGLVKRLHRYGATRMAEAGFNVDGWACEVYTMDGDEPPANRAYCVEFSNNSGGAIGVQGILMSRGYPQLDHGLTIDEGRSA